MTPTNYSKRLGNISPEQFQKALERFALGSFVKAEQIPFGLFGQNVFLTSSIGEFVFRGAPHYTWQFPTERFFSNILRQYTKTSVPFPYLFEPDENLFGWGFVIMPRLPGLTTQDPELKARLTNKDRLGISRAVAKMLVEIQTLTWDCCGSYQAETGLVEPFEVAYRERIIRNIREKVEDACRSNDNTTLLDKQYIESILTKTNRYLHLPFQPTIVLGDYGEHNLVVNRSSGDWEVSGVFDLMTAHFGDGAADLAGPVMGYLKENALFAEAFVQEYLLSKPITAGFLELQQLYMLDLTLSIWRYFQKYEGGLPEDKTKKWTFEQYATPFIDYWVK